MELHESLAQLARDHGQALFTDADAFRGALDDYLDEGAASTGTINLLTDAVRLGALHGLLTMLDSGARVEDAVESAGQRLSRDRGSADVTGSQWACAVLGYALGRVPVELATRLRPDATTAGAPGPTAERPAPPPGPPPTVHRPAQSPPSAVHQSPASPVHQSPAQQPTAAPGAAPQGGWQQPPGQQPGWGTPPWQPPQQKKSRTGLIIGLAAAAVVLVILGVVTVVALANGDDEPSDDPTTAESSDGETTDTASPTTDAPTTPTTDAGGNTLRGTGYTYQLPNEDWQDVTDSTPDSTGTIDTIAAPGDEINSARGNILVETSSSYGQDDPAELKDQWKAVISQSTGATPTDLPDTTIGDLPAVGIELEWTNPNNFEVRQVAYLVVHGDDQYSITASFRQGDDEFEQTFHDVLETWAWE